LAYRFEAFTAMMPIDAFEFVESPITELTECLEVKLLTIISIQFFWQIGIMGKLAKKASSRPERPESFKTAVLAQSKADRLSKVLGLF
jgi:cellobiose-specific phosphotransferase system component IIC